MPLARTGVLEAGLGMEDEDGVKTVLRFETLLEIADTTSGPREESA